MPRQTRETIKKYFEKGDRPTAGQFADLIDSIPNIEDDGFNIIIYPKGNWASGVSYIYGDSIYYDGSTYYCLVAHTSDNSKIPPSFPEEQNTWWKVLAKKGNSGNKGDKGDTGETGSVGPQGLKGDTGATGAQGKQGEQGPAGTDGLDITWKGAYNTLISYSINDAVSFNGSSYICKVASTGNLPTNATYWDLMAQKGNDGLGSGDMLTSVYDPTSKNTDAFDMDNMVEGLNTKIMTASERDNLANQSGVNTGDQTLPVKATGAEINTGTDDAKFATAKAIKDSILFNLPEGTMYNGKIVPSVDGSGNLTVALKGMDGNDPSATNPVYVRIDGVIRSITAALSATASAGYNLFNAGSAELATKEIDYFVYLIYDTSHSNVAIAISRVPYGNLVSDLNVATTTNEKFLLRNAATGASDVMVNIGRFAATLSAGAGYTWSVPTFTASNLIQNKEKEARELFYVATQTWSGTPPSGGTNVFFRYKIVGKQCFIRGQGYSMTAGSGNTSVAFTLPISPTAGASNIFLLNGSVSVDSTPNLSRAEINYSSGNLVITFSSINATAFFFQGYYTI